MTGIFYQKRILVIEDEEDIRKNIADILQFEGYRVLSAANGHEGIEMAAQELPDLILCDILMPDINGFEVLKKRNKNSELASRPFIFLTALDDREHFRHGMESGIDDYLPKPFTREELLTAIKVQMQKTSELKAYINQKIHEIHQQVSRELKMLQNKLEEKEHSLSHFSAKNRELEKQLKEKELELMKDTFQTIELNNKLQHLKELLQKELLNPQLPKSSRNTLSSLIKKTNEKMVLWDNWTIFLLKFKQVYPHFIYNLTNRFSDLTQYEMVFISAHILGLNTKQLADLLYISDDSVRKSRYRIKKKLGLKKEDDFLNYIHSLNKKPHQV